jgi:hypothetical protein
MRSTRATGREDGRPEGVDGEQRDDRAGPEEGDEGHPLAVAGPQHRTDTHPLGVLLAEVGDGEAWAVDLGEDLVGLLDAAGPGQPARRLGGAHPQQHDDQPRQGSAGQHPAPAAVYLEEELPHDVGRSSADEPHADVGAEQLPPPAARDELREQRRRDRVVGADGDADQQAQHDEPIDVAHERLGDGARDERDEIDREEQVSPELVGEPPAEEGAEEDADERRGPGEALLVGREAELGGELDHRDADDAQDVAIQERPSGGEDRQLLVEVRQGRVVECV